MFSHGLFLGHPHVKQGMMLLLFVLDLFQQAILKDAGTVRAWDSVPGKLL